MLSQNCSGESMRPAGARFACGLTLTLTWVLFSACHPPESDDDFTSSPADLDALEQEIRHGAAGAIPNLALIGMTCTAVLVTPTVLITAAHCVVPIKGDPAPGWVTIHYPAAPRVSDSV